ncbi:MAG TPA: CHAP domain-containing protein [Candidatus Dormibacteraeota bacterium]|nr:CHAP domain-containing protein [Candidatus Dormibacteraeota bacterium]
MSQIRIKRALRAAAQVGVFGIAAMAASLLSTGTASASYQSQIAADQLQQNDLISQLQSLEGQAASAGQNAANTQQQITAIQQKLSQDQITLSQVNAELTATSNKLTATEAQMTRDRTQLAALVTVLYQRGATNSLAAAIANSSSISKLVDDSVDLQTVRQQFDSLTQQLIADATALKTLQAQQTTQEQQVTALVSGLQSQSDQLQAAETTYSKEQSSLTGEAGQISAAIQSLSTQIQVLQEEEAASAGGGSLGDGGTILQVYSNPNYPNFGSAADNYPPGQCTWFVASQAYVGWSANANGWISGNASMLQPYSTGVTPEVNSMVVWRGGGAYSSLGHVAWVIQTGDGTNGQGFVVEEANFISGHEDTRLVPNTSGVLGFIYP